MPEETEEIKYPQKCYVINIVHFFNIHSTNQSMHTIKSNTTHKIQLMVSV